MWGRAHDVFLPLATYTLVDGTSLAIGLRAGLSSKKSQLVVWRLPILHPTHSAASHVVGLAKLEPPLQHLPAS